MPSSKEDAAELGDSVLVVSLDLQEMFFVMDALQVRARAESLVLSVSKGEWWAGRKWNNWV